LASKSFGQPPPAGEPQTRADSAASAGWLALGQQQRSAAAAALLYAAFGVAWILWSDRLLFGLASDRAALRALGEWKGLAFVALSACWVGVAGWCHRPASVVESLPGCTRLLVVLGLAMAAVVSVALVGTLRTSAAGLRSDLLWIAAADLAALLTVAVMVYGMHQRRELRAALRQRDEQQEKLRALGLVDAISNSTPDLIFKTDLEGRFSFVNPSVCQALDRPEAELIGTEVRSFFGAGGVDPMSASIAEVLESSHSACGETELAMPTGRRSYCFTLGPMREPDGQPSGVFGMLHDITEHRRQEERHRQWAKAFESTRDGVVICDATGHIESVNQAFTDITGYTAQEAIGQTPGLLHSGRHDASFYRGLWSGVIDNGHWQGEIWNRRRNGEIYPEWLTISAVRDDAGVITNYVGVFTDITRVKRDEAELQRLANYDPLTELPNRRLLISRLEQSVARMRRHGGRTALLNIDLDGFKTVNDSLGHPAGDELLVEVARRLGTRVRAGDTLGRVGGDEFLVIAESLHSPEEAAVLAQDLIDTVAKPVTLSDGKEVYVTASVGISLFPDDGCGDATGMMRDADAALYRAKDQGRNGFCFFTHDLNRQAIARLDLEVALRHALHRGELLLHYQPKVCAASGRVQGAEALLRWQRDGELVSPGVFIPIAEQSSLILDIGAWVIDEACAQQARWRAGGVAMPRIAVNVAARQFAAGNLDRVLGQALQRHGVPPDCLEVEVTESMLIERPAEGVRMLQKLKDIGVKLSLDDFGTGYSSLSYLHQFPIDALKIDKSFVDHIGSGPDGSAIVDAVIALAHRLGLAVVAEGVETRDQQEHLRRQGCDELQGFGLARPMPGPAFEAWCAARVVAPAPSSQP
jgi:diguanylate cyclase (GGDEF)-like protein/PAS domain S-box-containing protein